MIESSEIIKGKCDVVESMHHSGMPSIIDRKEAYTDIIDEGISIIKSADTDAEGLADYKQKLVVYRWAEEFKQFAILLRDIHHKGFKELYRVGTLPAHDIVYSTLKRASHEVITQLNEILKVNASNESDLKVWKHQLSPGKTVVAQLHSINEQIEMIGQSHDEMQDAERDILFYNTEITSSVGSFGQNIDTLLKSVTLMKKSLGDLGANPELSAITALTKQIDTAYETVDGLRGSAKINDWHFGGNHKIKVPVGTNEGNLVVKQVDFDSQINDWVEGEIVPSLLDMDAQVERLDYSTLTKIVNVKNQLSLLASNPELISNLEGLNFESTFDEIIVSANEMKVQIEASQDEVRDKLKQKLSIATVFDKDTYFLSKSPVSLITSYTREGNKWIGKIPVDRFKKWYTGIFDRYIASGSEEENKTRDQIDLINFIKSRSLGNVDQYYHSLFYSKGFLGQTFYTPRKPFDDKFDTVLENWNEGYPGSLLVFGKHLSGKSTLLQALSQNHTRYPIIDLKPNAEIVFNGHKIKVTANLGETFKILDKYTRAEKVIVLIDDLELWGGSKDQFLGEANMLIQIMKKHTRRYFFLVATNQQMKEDLDRYTQFSKHFTATFDSSIMDSEEIAKIIGVRDRASHRSDETNYNVEKVTELNSQAIKVAKNCSQNVGVSLIEWTREEELSRKQRSTPKSFYSVVNNHREVLRYILKWGTINEAVISKYRNAEVVRDMSTSIRELVSLQILTRDIDGKLKIPNSLVDEVEEVIESQSALTIEHYG